MGFRAGFVAVVGRPNVGKSSLVNTLVGQKVAIVSDKPQTTRLPIRGILTREDFQIVFTDTPGFHKPRTALGEVLNQRVGETVADAEVVLLVVDAAAGVGRGDAYVAQSKVVPHPGPKVCAVNKVDLLRHHAVVPQLAAAGELAEFDHIVPVSAKTGAGTGDLLQVLVDALPEGEPIYPEGVATDLPLSIRVGEVIREKALAVTREEVPHSIAVVVEELERDEGRGLTRVQATVYVERESQKPIVIGKGGQTLKTIGTRAREELELLLGSRVYLELRVKVQREWQRDPAALARLGV
ncbi:MAG TPA: GTPase Era [Actinomycetota bacterium]|nr:GTPase Era [Actinomycetota bacterium]